MKKFHSLLIFLLWSSGFLLAQQSPDCEENVDATQDTEVVANTLQASNTLTVNRKLNSGDTLRLIGGQLIELLPGFEADEGSFIEGGNGDCVDLSAVLSSHIIACSVTQPVSDEGSDGVVTISISNMNFAGTIDIQWQQDGTLQNNKFDVDGSNPDKDVEIENLSAGTYEFVVSYTLRDYIGKIFTQTCTVTFTEKVLVEECEILGEDLPIRGTDGQLYCYKWSPSDDISEGYTDEDREIRVCPESSTDYFVTITDGLNVIEVKEFEVIKCDLEVTIESSAPAICNGEAVTLTASTSCTDCTYEWLSGESSASITLIEWDIVSVTITDSEGCKAEASLFIDDSPSVDGGIFVEKLSICNGEATTLSINEDVDVVWEDGSTDNERIITGGGLYSATMTDEFGCVTEDEVQIRENFKPTVNIVQSSQKLCEGGSVLLSLETNASDFFAEWSNGEDGDEIVVKEAGSYTVTLTDQNDCTTESEPIDLEGFGEQGAPSVVINADSPILCGVDNEVTLAVEILEETQAPYTYEWSNPEMGTLSEIGVSDPGVYSVVVSDANGCQGSASFDVKTSPRNRVELEPEPAVICPDGELKLFAPDNAVSYSWSTDDGTIEVQEFNSATVSEAGTYNVELTYSNGCKDDGEITVTEYDEEPTISYNGVSYNDGDIIYVTDLAIEGKISPILTLETAISGGIEWMVSNTSGDITGGVIVGANTTQSITLDIGAEHYGLMNVRATQYDCSGITVKLCPVRLSLGLEGTLGTLDNPIPSDDNTSEINFEFINTFYSFTERHGLILSVKITQKDYYEEQIIEGNQWSWKPPAERCGVFTLTFELRTPGGELIDNISYRVKKRCAGQVGGLTATDGIDGTRVANEGEILYVVWKEITSDNGQYHPVKYDLDVDAPDGFDENEPFWENRAHPPYEHSPSITVYYNNFRDFPADASSDDIEPYLTEVTAFGVTKSIQTNLLHRNRVEYNLASDLIKTTNKLCTLFDKVAKKLNKLTGPRPANDNSGISLVCDLVLKEVWYNENRPNSPLYNNVQEWIFEGEFGMKVEDISFPIKNASIPYVLNTYMVLGGDALIKPNFKIKRSKIFNVEEYEIESVSGGAQLTSSQKLGGRVELFPKWKKVDAHIDIVGEMEWFGGMYVEGSAITYEYGINAISVLLEGEVTAKNRDGETTLFNISRKVDLLPVATRTEGILFEF